MPRLLVVGALALACRRDPAPPAPADELATRLAEAVAAKGPGYKPRTRHLNPDGSPRFTNRLILERSPYLLQHAHNPVDWYPWGDEAFAKATAEGKPIFLSIGYSTCHWCHVMEEESFEDEDIARALNRDFVPIKVDREERPDLDGIYMAAVQRLTGDGGWPMTVFLLPDRRPFYAGTYFPPHDGDRGVGLDTTLARVRAAYDRDPARLAQGAAALVAELTAQAHGTSEASSSAIRTAVAGLARSYDADWGGFARAPKFPRPSALDLVLRYARRTGDDKALAMVTHTLDRIAAGGIHDQVGGGFHRYATDTRWRVPHFEKMLYDNAQLASLYVAAWQATGRAAYAEVARDTLDYLLRDMRAPDGAFWAASDADAGGVEGATFVWTAAEIDRVVGVDGAIVRSAYDVAASGTSILWRPDSLADVAARVAQPVEKVQAALAAARPALLAARQKRVQPAIDRKVLVAWNGLAISALARAGLALDEPRYVAAARAAATTVLAHGRVHSVTDGVAGGPAFLDDLALLEAGLLDLYEADPDARWLREAIALQAAIDADFADARGGYYLTSSAGEQLLVRDKPDVDDPIPSGNSVAAANLLRLAELTGDERHRKQAFATIRAFALEGMPAMLGALDFALDKAKQIVIVAPPGGGDAPLLAQVRAAYVPNRVLVRVREGEALPQVLPLVDGKRARGGAATAYVCVGTYCEQPTQDPDVLAKQLARIEALP